MSEIDFTAARVLAVAARDAAVRLREELWRLGVCEDDGDAAGAADGANDVVDYANRLIGKWTRAADLLPQPHSSRVPPQTFDPWPCDSFVWTPPSQPWQCSLSSDAKCPNSPSGRCERDCPGEWCDLASPPKPQAGGRGVESQPAAAKSKPPTSEERLEAEVAAVAKSLSDLLGVPVVPVKLRV